MIIASLPFCPRSVISNTRLGLPNREGSGASGCAERILHLFGGAVSGRLVESAGEDSDLPQRDSRASRMSATDHTRDRVPPRRLASRAAGVPQKADIRAAKNPRRG